MTDTADSAGLARGLVRALDRASLATLAADGAPYASLVLAAADLDGTPLLLLSQLAEHTRNLAADARASLLFDGTAGLDSPLTGPRVTLQGRLQPSAEPRHRARFLARHPEAAQYAGFGDFGVYRLEPARAHLVAGFGRIHWIEAADLLPDRGPWPLAGQEEGVLAHMNAEHAHAVQLYAVRLLGAAGGGWRLTGVDPEGCDLRRGGAVLRLRFERPVHDAEAARSELVRLVKQARQQEPAG